MSRDSSATSNQGGVADSSSDRHVPTLTLVDPSAHGASAQSCAADPDRRYWLLDRWRHRGRKNLSGNQEDELLDEDELYNESLGSHAKGTQVDTCPLERQSEFVHPAAERLLGLLDPVVLAQETDAKVVDYKAAPEVTTAPDSIMDVLYENQDGCWLFGRPYFSEKPGHVATWTTVDYRPSQTNPSSAAVPDPSWEWAWPSWYIDMSHDVDENGWQYSLAFSDKFCWHGNHPWFHSFVRRRRWLRLRVRRKEGKSVLRKQERHADHQSHLDNMTYSPVQARAQEPDVNVGVTGHPVDSTKDRGELQDLPTLLAVLRDSILDREKLGAVDRYIGQDTEDQADLPDKMQEIMRLFLFESSRQKLLEHLTDRIDDIPADQVDEKLQKKRDTLTRARLAGSKLLIPRQ
ncbi:hypothetical protein KEM56_003565 [Ascosphaera pollenicola]|nr:hypothetical protein KEM56_003565 [Ascosphaera pollenicola]